MPSTAQSITFRETRDLDLQAVLQLYRANAWSAADKPNELYRALLNSHGLVTAWDENKLVGLANAITDGSLVVFFPHALVLPDYQKQGIGAEMMRRLQIKYSEFHQQILLADASAVDFYHKLGFVRAGATVPMWVFDGDEH